MPVTGDLEIRINMPWNAQLSFFAV